MAQALASSRVQQTGSQRLQLSLWNRTHTTRSNFYSNCAPIYCARRASKNTSYTQRPNCAPWPSLILARNLNVFPFESLYFQDLYSRSIDTTFRLDKVCSSASEEIPS